MGVRVALRERERERERRRRIDSTLKKSELNSERAGDSSAEVTSETDADADKRCQLENKEYYEV